MLKLFKFNKNRVLGKMNLTYLRLRNIIECSLILVGLTKNKKKPY